MTGVPLVIDLDGTLLKSDLLQESTLKLLSGAPRHLFSLPGWLYTGKAHLKRQVAQRVTLDIASLPYDAGLIAWLEHERSAGRSIVLCSASDETFVSQVADHLGLFDEVIASDGVTNVSAERKAAILVDRFGAKNFDYVGNSHDDVPVWAQARRAVLVSAGAGVRSAAARVATIEREFDEGRGGLRSWIAALRLHQWAKNLLVFMPLLASHRFEELLLVRSAVLAFFAFGLCASSVYLLNDLMDLESDRHHPRKRLRAFASGMLSPQAGLWVCAALLLGALWLGWQIGPAFTIWLDIYLGLTLLYTFLLKRKILVDALTLAALYTLRILAGGAAVAIWPGFWLLAFSLFLFLSLAFVKRYSEVSVQLAQGRQGTQGRDYLISDLPLIEMLGIVSGFAAVVVMALYINGNSITQLYPNQDVIWLTVPILLYWISRMWVKAHRGEMHDDPVVFALGDGISLLTIAAFVAVMAAGSIPW